MNKKTSIVRYNMYFLTSLLIEVFCIFIYQNLYFVIGAGAFVLLTGYLFLSSIRKKWTDHIEKTKFMIQQIHKEEIDKWDLRYNEILNLNKATYGAYKKSYAMMIEKFDRVSKRLDVIEKENADALQKIIELQKLSMDGQKKALNYEVNYNKENTVQIINAIKNINVKDFMPGEAESEKYAKQHNLTGENDAAKIEPVKKPEKEPEASAIKEKEKTVSKDNVSVEAAPEGKTVTPLYDDPNKELTTEEIAKLFSTFGK